MKLAFREKFIATVSAAAITLTGMTAPARADDDFLKTLAIVAGAALVGKVIYDQTQAQRQRANVPSGQMPQITPRRSPSANAPVLVSTSLRPVARPVSASTGGTPVYDRSPLDGIIARPLPDRVTRTELSLLPGDCLRSAELGTDSIQYFPADCLSRQSVDVSELPLDCARDVGTRRNASTGFEARCLSRAGYRLAPT
jgi:hypothetical protein